MHITYIWVNLQSSYFVTPPPFLLSIYVLWPPPPLLPHFICCYFLTPPQVFAWSATAQYFATYFNSFNPICILTWHSLPLEAYNVINYVFLPFLPFFRCSASFYGITIRVTEKTMVPAGKTTSEKLGLMFKKKLNVHETDL